jgi:Fe-S cluster biogenesis protein NfuA
MPKKELISRIEAALDKIRPYLKADGGDVEFVSIDDNNILKVRMIGACDGCPFSLHTLKAGVEQTILHEIPEIKEVVTD